MIKWTHSNSQAATCGMLADRSQQFRLPCMAFISFFSNAVLSIRHFWLVEPIKVVVQGHSRSVAATNWSVRHNSGEIFLMKAAFQIWCKKAAQMAKREPQLRPEANTHTGRNIIILLLIVKYVAYWLRKQEHGSKKQSYSREVGALGYSNHIGCQASSSILPVAPAQLCRWDYKCEQSELRQISAFYLHFMGIVLQHSVNLNSFIPYA